MLVFVIWELIFSWAPERFFSEEFSLSLPPYIQLTPVGAVMSHLDPPSETKTLHPPALGGVKRTALSKIMCHPWGWPSSKNSPLIYMGWGKPASRLMGVQLRGTVPTPELWDQLRLWLHIICSLGSNASLCPPLFSSQVLIQRTLPCKLPALKPSPQEGYSVSFLRH